MGRGRGEEMGEEWGKEEGRKWGGEELFIEGGLERRKEGRRWKGIFVGGGVEGKEGVMGFGEGRGKEGRG